MRGANPRPQQHGEKEMKIWLITDTHLNHDAMVEYCGRPKNHTEIILRNWAMKVRPEDLTIHLGDVIFKRSSELAGMLSGVPGRKVLVLGNHDGNKPIWYMERGFDFACTSLVFENILFTHGPVKKLPDGCYLNIHGHWHNNEHRLYERPLKPFNKLLAIENTRLRPVLLNEFIRKEKDEYELRRANINPSVLDAAGIPNTSVFSGDSRTDNPVAGVHDMER